MYYIPKEDSFVLENITDEIFTIISHGEEYTFMPGEKRTFTTEEIRLYEEKDRDNFVHTGCTGFAVEVDGKRYWYDKKKDRGNPERIEVLAETLMR